VNHHEDWKNYRFSEQESPFLQVWDESEVGYEVPLKTGRFVVLQVSEKSTLFYCIYVLVCK